MGKYNYSKIVPQPIKKLLLRIFYFLKGLKEDLQDFSAEIIGNIPSHTVRLYGYRFVCKVKIGNHTSIHRCCRMYKPSKITIGNNSVINYGVLLDGRSELEIGDNVSISDGTVILTLGHDIDDPMFSTKGGKVTIQDSVFIGSSARILPGVIIGEGAIVGVGAVVTHDVKPYTVVGGVPARFIRNRNRDIKYKLDYRKRFG